MKFVNWRFDSTPNENSPTRGRLRYPLLGAKAGFMRCRWVALSIKYPVRDKGCAIVNGVAANSDTTNRIKIPFGKRMEVCVVLMVAALVGFSTDGDTTVQSRFQFRDDIVVWADGCACHC